MNYDSKTEVGHVFISQIKSVPSQECVFNVVISQLCQYVDLRENNFTGWDGMLRSRDGSTVPAWAL